MKPGAVIVDLAVEQGGNVEGSELDKIVVKNGVKIVGFANLPARVAADASALYARNVLNFLALSLNAKTGEFNVPQRRRNHPGDAGVRKRTGRRRQEVAEPMRSRP